MLGASRLSGWSSRGKRSSTLDRKCQVHTILTLRGKYDEEYIDYLIRLLKQCKAHGLRVCKSVAPEVC